QDCAAHQQEDAEGDQDRSAAHRQGPRRGERDGLLAGRGRGAGRTIAARGVAVKAEWPQTPRTAGPQRGRGDNEERAKSQLPPRWSGREEPPPRGAHFSTCQVILWEGVLWRRPSRLPCFWRTSPAAWRTCCRRWRARR